VWFPVDHLSFFIKRKILPQYPEELGKQFSRISCRMWTVSIVCDYARDIYKLYYHQDRVDLLLKKKNEFINTISEVDHVLELEKRAVETSKKPDSAKRKFEMKQIELLKNRQVLEDGQRRLLKEIEKTKEDKIELYLNMATNVFNLPMAIDLSTKEGILHDVGPPLLGSLGSILAFYSKWRSLK
jgi:hypothetical protein